MDQRSPRPDDLEAAAGHNNANEKDSVSARDSKDGSSKQGSARDRKDKGEKKEKNQSGEKGERSGEKGEKKEKNQKLIVAKKGDGVLKFTRLTDAGPGDNNIKDVSGELREGQILAIVCENRKMSSTLLSILGGRGKRDAAFADGQIRFTSFMPREVRECLPAKYHLTMPSDLGDGAQL